MRFYPIKHSHIYYLGLILLAIGLPLSKFLMSIAQIVLVANWLLEGNYKYKLQRFWNNTPAILLSSLFLLHLLGLFYTSNFDYAWNDIRIKLPLLVLPLLIASSDPLNKTAFHCLMILFITAVFAGTMVSTYVFLYQQVDDIRNISPFISHIRFGLNICLSIYTLIYFFSFQKKKTHQFIIIVLLSWLVYFLIMLESVTGILILFISAYLLFVFLAWNHKKKLAKVFYLFVLLLIPISIFLYINYSIQQLNKVNPIDLNHLDKYTSHGEKYVHQLNNQQLENGNYVWLYVAWNELKEAWNQKSNFDFDSKDIKGQFVSTTLIRFLTSKGLRKDADGINQLRPEEIRAIESGIAHAAWMDARSLQTRLSQIIWEINHYINGGNPEGNSVTQRIEFWKAATHIIKNNFMFGVGTGDLQDAYNTTYPIIKSPLSEKYWLRAHNQYLTIWVSFGLIGFLWFMTVLLYPLFNTLFRYDYFFILFFIIAMLSFINEDTLETQAGVSFFSFFYCLFLFGKNKS